MFRKFSACCILASSLVLSVTLMQPAYTGAQATYPTRPDIPPGGSNWPVPGAPGVTSVNGLVTTDLTGGMTPTDVINSLVGGSGITISNVVYTGAPVALGTFAGGTGIVGFESGIILSSGNIASVAGPNLSDGITTDNMLAGDPDLDALIPGYETHDATVLEFDFTCDNVQVISFQYVFASDEYNEFVNSPFNDVFGFFVNGINIALLPDMATPVAINNLNCGNPYAPPAGPYCNLFINNDLSDGGGTVNSEMDGLTTVMIAQTPVLPGTNHIKLAIADAGDWILDSDIFLKAESFVCGFQLQPPVDIKPTSCPNPFEMRADGTLDISPEVRNPFTVEPAVAYNNESAVLPVAVLGTEDFNATDIDPESVTLNGVPALRWAWVDVAAPVGEEAEECECTTAGPDGYMDLTLKFNRSAIAATLGPVSDGEFIALTLTGMLLDGTEFSGSDCIWIRLKGRGAISGIDEPAISESYPNPFNATTTIRYTLNEAGDVNLSVFNVLGQRVTTLVNGFQPAGEHSVSWTAGNVPSGMYFYRLQMAGKIVTRTMTLLK